MEGRAPIVPTMLEVQQPVDASRMADEPREIVHLGATGSRGGRAAKWMDWMDCALVRQVLATDSLNCGRGRTVAKWAEVADVLQRLELQPILRSQESCRQRVKKLVEIYKKGELRSLRKSGINEDFGEFELNMVELATRWDQSSIDPTTRRLAQEKAAGLERDGRRVREVSMRGLVRRQDEGEDSLEGTISGATAQPTKKPKNATMKAVEKVLEEFTAGMREDKEEMKELEAKHDQKYEDLMRGILGLTDEIREQSEQRSHDAYLE
ncbi:hypothetical protein L873DRAFT_1793099 [Choiromyces venosus 120613-1]|uniref:Myb/SANT-like domain-containing protein n=1 Tax=Choiromyces venosus 120613-1 TaxID=1336337 RepID=A0A3N4J7H9_9PEZI|nr:hypothetical protein L873DRAFT_1793099 [Choiromyces venosus 120613-1]